MLLAELASTLMRLAERFSSTKDNRSEHGLVVASVSAAKSIRVTKPVVSVPAAPGATATSAGRSPTSPRPLFYSEPQPSPTNHNILTPPQSDEDDNDPVDRLPVYREECRSTCVKEIADYDACVKRIEEKGSGDCEAWYFDSLKCIDKCVVPKQFEGTK